MSRRDARKALVIGLPENLRKSLVTQSHAHLSLAYLVRQALRRAMDAGLGWTETVSPSDRRPILVQLSCEERARLEMWIKSKDVSEEEAVLSLIAVKLAEEDRQAAKEDVSASDKVKGGTRRGKR
jgi:hypothetical protein